MSNIQHSSATNEWYTPHKYTECAHKVLDGIEFDPFSCAYANTHHVRAIEYLSEGGFDIANWMGAISGSTHQVARKRTNLGFS
jgi:hypothetical protein